MKCYLPYEFLKQICLSIAEQLEDVKFEAVVGIARGGLTPAQIIAKRLKLPCEYYSPITDVLTAKQNSLLFIDDLVAKGRTYELVRKYINDKSLYVPILIDERYFNKQFFPCYGLITPHWIVFPYEEYDKVEEKDWGLFREGTDSYGK